MRLANQQEAMAITQELLDIVDAGFTANDFDMYAPAIYIPHHIRTKTEVFDIRSIEELRVAFLRYCDYAREIEGSYCKRICTRAAFKAKDRIEATYSVSYYRDDNSLTLPTTYTTSVLMRINRVWRICGSDNTTRISTGIGKAVRQAIEQNTKVNA